MLKINQPISPLLLKEIGRKIYGNHGRTKAWGLFECQCGIKFESSLEDIKSGHRKSCGCYRSALRSANNMTHGLSNTRLYKIWANMIQRCTNINNNSFDNYGKKGIKVCDEWINSFETFNIWAIENKYTDDLEIDRIDYRGNYESNNCRWVDLNIQAQNKRCIQKNNTSGYRGVSWNPDHKKWHTYININGKRKELGYFTNIIDGAKKYNEFVLENMLEHPLNILPN